MGIPLPHGPPSSGNHAPDFAAALLSKIEPAFGKEGRVSALDLECVSPGGKMAKTNHEHSNNGYNGAESARIWKARNFIHAHSNEDLSLGKVAKVANTSANYFSEKFKEATGINFVKYVARTRYEKTVILLRDADLRISEIAFACGFESLSQFNRIFKKFSGKSPTEFRATARRRNRKRGQVRFFLRKG
jgi:AraC-like DNA-binding protein